LREKKKSKLSREHNAHLGARKIGYHGEEKTGTKFDEASSGIQEDVIISGGKGKG